MAYALFTIILLSSLALSVANPKKTLLVAVTFLPWQGLYADLGLNASVFLAIWTPLAVIATLTKSVPAAHVSRTGLLFFFWAVLSCLWHLPFLPDIDIAGGELRRPVLHSITQLVVFFITVTPYWVIARILERADELKMIGIVYIWSATALAILGWVQLTVYYVTGKNITPATSFGSWLGTNDMAPLSAIVASRGDIYFRMSSLAGEPKSLAAEILVALIILQTHYLYFGQKRRHFFLSIFLLLTLYLTYSSTGFAVLLAMQFVLAFVPFVPALSGGGAGFRHRYRLVMACAAAFVGILGAAALIGPSNEYESGTLRIIYERTIGRLQTEEEAIGQYFHEDFDGPIITLLLNDPSLAIVGTGLGNAHIYADKYLHPTIAAYAGGGAFRAKRGYLRWLSEIGVIGLSLFIAWIYTEVSTLSKSLTRRRVSPIWAAFMTCLSIQLFVAYMISAQFSFHFFLAMGIAVATTRRANLMGTSNNRLLARQKDA